MIASRATLVADGAPAVLFVDLGVIVQTVMSMADVEVDRWERRVAGVITALLVGATVVIPYVADRAARRWWRQNDPFADIRIRLARARASAQHARADAEEVGQLIADLLAMRTQPPSSTR